MPAGMTRRISPLRFSDSVMNRNMQNAPKITYISNQPTDKAEATESFTLHQIEPSSPLYESTEPLTHGLAPMTPVMLNTAKLSFEDFEQSRLVVLPAGTLL